MFRSFIRTVAVGAVLLGVVLPCAAQSRVTFGRSVLNPDGSLRSSTIYRVNTDGTGFLQLGAMTTGVHRFDPQWSPSGNTILYSYIPSPGASERLYRMNATGGARTRLTFGTADHRWARWRPDGGMIAYVAAGSSGSCLAVVRPDATGQRNIFCPPGPGWVDNIPMWSADGTRIFVSTGFFGPGLEPPYQSRAYSVNATTGAATLLTAQTLDEPRIVYFHPSGTHGLYADPSGNEPIDAVDFATDVLVPRTVGFAPVWSRGGTRFAYSRTEFSGLDQYAHVWIMAADGSTDVEVTPPIANNLEYTAVEFSRDATRLMTNRTIYSPISPGSGLYVGATAIRLFNVASGTWVNLPNGVASDWYQP